MISKFVVAILCTIGTPRAAVSGSIDVDAGRDICRINPLVFGTNLHAKNESTEQVKAFIRNTGLSIYRYPDGGSYYYLDKPGDGWGSVTPNKAAGDKLAKSYLGCFKNVRHFARETGCGVTACANVENGTVDAAVQWVKYAKQTNLGIKYWCLGNEVYYDAKLKEPRNYAACIANFAAAMKAADPSIKIGMDFGNAFRE